MPDPLASQDIARASFSTVRRGYEPQAVRGFLHEVSALVDRLTRSEKELREQLQVLEARMGSGDEPDEAHLLEVLGAETTRVLTSAHEAAADIRSKAEAAAERTIADATSEAARLRDTATQEVEALVAKLTAEAEQMRDAAHNELELRRAEAHAAAERIQEEAREAAAATWEEGQAALDQAQDEAAAIVEAAQQKGREMVAEAQAVRERVLRDLAVRRKRARQQVEKLNAGRERLLRAYETVRGTLDEATTELHVSITDARIAANAAARRVEEEPDTSMEELDAEVSAAGLVDLPITVTDEAHEHDELFDSDEGSGPLSGEVPAVATDADVVRPNADPQPAEAGEVGEAGDAAELDDGGPRTLTNLDERRSRKGGRRKKGFEGLPPAELTVLEPPRPDEGVRVIGEEVDDALPVEREPDPEPEPIVDPDAAPEPEAASVADETPAADEVFARLREQTGAADADDVDVDVEADADAGAGAANEDVEDAEAQDAEVEDAEVEDAEAEDAEAEDADADPAAREAFAARSAAVGPVEKDLLKRLKRALADEQNEVLDLLRRAKPKGLEDVLPAADEHAAQWQEAAAPALVDAAAAGAAVAKGKAGPVTTLAEELARTLVDPLRERIDRSFVAADGDLDDVADRVRALYREWKGQRLTEASQHFTGAAYARGMFDGIPKKTPVRWVVDASHGACPDCDDNALAGAIPKGEEFPTGNPCAPAHPGCHCLVLPAD